MDSTSVTDLIGSTDDAMEIGRPLSIVGGDGESIASLPSTAALTQNIETILSTEQFSATPLNEDSVLPSSIWDTTPTSSIESSVSLSRDRSSAKLQAKARKKQARRTVFRGSKQTIVGSPQKDILDVSKGKGKNVVKGLGGNDTLRANTQDKLSGNGGNDRLTVKSGKGRNRLQGGAGRDRLIVWKRDRAFGNGGPDFLTAWGKKGNNQLNGGGGNDVLIGYDNDRLTGGPGADEFRVVNRRLPKKLSRITDFKIGVDKISLRGLTAQQSSELRLTQQGKNTIVNVGDVAIARLNNVAKASLNSSSFLGVSAFPQSLQEPTPTPAPTPSRPGGMPRVPEPILRNPILQPFASTSIWNTPIGNNAQYVPAKIQPAFGVSADVDHFYVLSENDPTQEVFRIGSWRNRSSGTQSLGINLPLPNHLLLPDANSIETLNNSSAFLLPDGKTLAQFNATTRPDVGGDLYGVPYADVQLDGDGIEGGHGGSGLSSIGGTLRIGELTGDDPIQHALKINLWAEKYLSYSQGDQGGLGYRWPAVKADGYANPNTYGGTVPELMMGSLLAIPPTVSAESLGLDTEPGRKLFNAFQDYGAYVADDTAFDTHAFAMESGALQDFEYRYGYAFDDNEGLFFEDVMALFSALHVVDNNTVNTIGGGGALRQPRLPDIGTTYVSELQTLLNNPNVQDTFEADFNNDGLQDLLWRNLATGANQLWLRNRDGKLNGGGNILPLADPNWQIQSTPDLNGDGRADILWSHQVTNAKQEWYLEDLRRWIDPVTGQRRYRWKNTATGVPTIVFP